MKNLSVRLYCLCLALTALPLMELEFLHWLKGTSFRQFLSSSLLAPLFTQLFSGFLLTFLKRLFGVV